jgi:hypothetical protein
VADESAGAPWDFESTVDAVVWGRSRYTVVRVPEGLAAGARAEGTRRVAGTIDDQPVDLALNRAPVVDGPFLWAGASLLRRLRVEAGEPVTCRLAPADPDEVLLPDDVERALVAAGVLGTWEALPAPTRRRRLQPVASARTAGTRERRVRELVDGL